jgi:hypothetical protein
MTFCPYAPTRGQLLRRWALSTLLSISFVVGTGLEPAISPTYCQRALPISHPTMASRTFAKVVGERRPPYSNSSVVRTGFEPVTQRLTRKEYNLHLTTIPPPDYFTRLSELSSVTSARLPKTCQVPDAGLIRPSGASVSRPITKPVKVSSARKERSQDRIRTCTKRGHLPLMGLIPSPSVLPYHVASTISPPDYFEDEKSSVL